MKILAGLQGYKSFIVNTLTAIFNILIALNIQFTPETQGAIIGALVTIQGLIAHVMRLITKTPPGKDVDDVRESVVKAVETKTDDVLGSPDEI